MKFQFRLGLGEIVSDHTKCYLHITKKIASIRNVRNRERISTSYRTKKIKSQILLNITDLSSRNTLFSARKISYISQEKIPSYMKYHVSVILHLISLHITLKIALSRFMRILFQIALRICKCK